MRPILVSLLICLTIGVLFIACDDDKSTNSPAGPKYYKVVVLTSQNNSSTCYWAVFDMLGDTLIDSIPNPYFGREVFSGPHYMNEQSATAFCTMHPDGMSYNEIVGDIFGDSAYYFYQRIPFCGECPAETSPDNHAIFLTNAVIDLPVLFHMVELDPTEIDGAFFIPGRMRFGHYGMISSQIHILDFAATGNGWVADSISLRDASGDSLLVQSVCPHVNGELCYVTCTRGGDITPYLFIMDSDSFTVVDSLPVGDYAIINDPVMTADGSKIYFTPWPGSFPERVLMEYDLVMQESRITVSDADIGHGLYYTKFELSPDERYIYFYGRTTLNPTGGVYELYKLNRSTGEFVKLMETIPTVGRIRDIAFRKL